VVNEARSAPYITSDYLRSAEDIRDYLNAALEDGSERVVNEALRNAFTAMRRLRAGDTALLGHGGACVEDVEQNLVGLNASLKEVGLTLSVNDLE
jgi:hypothetical protein